MTNVDELWRFVPEKDRAKFEEIAAVAGVSRGGALALKMCQEALRDYCPADERLRVAALLATIVTKGGVA